jgi:hypothetical protein
MARQDRERYEQELQDYQRNFPQVAAIDQQLAAFQLQTALPCDQLLSCVKRCWLTHRRNRALPCRARDAICSAISAHQRCWSSRSSSPAPGVRGRHLAARSTGRQCRSCSPICRPHP